MDSPAFARARLAMMLLAIDPAGLGGLWLRARQGPVRDAVLAGLGALPGPVQRLSPTVGDAALFGGMDVTTTLATGSVAMQPGLLDRAGTLLLSGAERTPPAQAARLAQALDMRHLPLIACDEGVEDQALPRALQDRLGFRVDLDEVPMAAITSEAADGTLIAEARARLARVALAETDLPQIATITAQLGIGSARAAQFALHAARALAALDGREATCQDDITAAIGLTCAHRATQMPELEDEQSAEEPEPPADEGESENNTESSGQAIPDDMLIAAALAYLPPDLLNRLRAGQMSRAKGAGAGVRRKGNRRGRPLPSRRGRLDGRGRLDLVATLRAAAPWQKLRGAGPGQVRIHPSDIHIRRYEAKSDRLLIFVVDASGSAALARLAEAKGAVEILLAEAYARRDFVALIAFRGTGAERLLPPTRSLVQTKKRLAALPGGGGTPLAAGLSAALTEAEQARARGMSPVIALMTDGRANVTLEGAGGRAQAAEEAQQMALRIRAAALDAIVIDVGQRPSPDLRDLAGDMAAPYLPLPRADARGLSDAARAALDA